MPQQATMDTTPLPAPPKRSLLNGQVSAEEASAGFTDKVDEGGMVSIKIQSTGDGPVTLSGAQLRAITDAIRNVLPDANTLKSSTPRFAGIKLKARTADDFRALQYGVIGMVSTKFKAAQPIVDNVFPTCPAALAGIQPGDAVVKANGYVFTEGDGPKEYWQRIGGKADTPIDVTVLRDGELLTFHMKRMNIEDIENVAVRNRYERVLGLFGPPSGQVVQISHSPNRISRPSLKSDDDGDADSTNDVSERRTP